MTATCDVLVIGAGVAGAAAAVAAARGGARTMLIEQEPYIGGTGYAGMFQYICGLYLNGEAVPKETLNTGLVREITALLQNASPEKSVRKLGQVFVLPYGRDELQSVLTLLCDGEKNIETLREYAAVSAEMENTSISAITIKGAQGEQAIAPKMVIDCSGGGSVAVMAGATYELAPNDERQLAGFVVRVKGMKNVDDSLPLKVPYYLAKAVEQGRFAPELRYTMFSHGEAKDEGYCKMSFSIVDEPPGIAQAQENANVMIKYLASVLPSFEGAYVADTSHKVLEREGRRITGEYILTKDDVLSARKFSDGIVKNSWPIELWGRSQGTSYKYVPRGDYYEVPFRCLTVKGISNLLTAGRCISVTHEALGSTRVMGTCMALGDQAGRAAAYRARNGKYPENIKDY
jgi:hypothetical protein